MTEAQVATRRTDWVALAREVGPAFAARAADHDERDAFVAENYAELQARCFFSAGVPAELGGGGAAHPELCTMLRELARQPRPGAPSAISLKVRQPTMTMLRRMMTVQRSARSSDARAIGQYCP